MLCPGVNWHRSEKPIVSRRNSLSMLAVSYLLYGNLPLFFLPIHLHLKTKPCAPGPQKNQKNGWKHLVLGQHTNWAITHNPDGITYGDGQTGWLWIMLRPWSFKVDRIRPPNGRLLVFSLLLENLLPEWINTRFCRRNFYPALSPSLCSRWYSQRKAIWTAAGV